MQDAIILYENGKAIGGEGHPTNASDITFNNTGTDLISEKVEGAIKEVNDKTSGLSRMTKLWENPSPTASFSAQTVTLNSADYDLLLIIAKIVNSVARCVSVICTKGQGGQLIVSNDSAQLQRARSFDYISNTQYSFVDAYKDNGGSYVVDNTFVIPIAIYGIKII